MSRKRILIILFLAVIAALLWWWLGTNRSQPPVAVTPAVKSSPSPLSATAEHTPQTAQAVEARRKEGIAKVQAIFATPIAFYGRVIDQNGDPVPDANVDYGVIDKFYQSGSDYTGRSDANGYFSISGIKGAVLTVGVDRKGYYQIDGKSTASFGYGMGPDTTRKVPPTKENPAIFVLQKMGETEPLIRVSRRQIDVPKTGQPLNIDLTTGQTGRGNLQLESWTGEKVKNRFNWRYRLSVPGGGLMERKGQFDFEAPADSYQPAIEVNMPASAEQWSDRLTRQYFAKLADGRYARFSVRFYAGDAGDASERNMVVLESYVNPKPGSRNLEFDPTKAVQSP